MQVQCHRLEKDNQQLMSDLGKANDIIHRKMDDHRTLKDKYRRNTEVIKKQEKFLNDKDEDIKKLATKLKTETDAGALTAQRIADLEKAVVDLTARLQTAEDKNVQDDKVITYLNKQLNTRAAAPPVNPYSQKIASSRNFELNSGNFTSSLPKSHSTPINAPGGALGGATVTPNEPDTAIGLQTSENSGNKNSHLTNTSNTSTGSGTSLPRPMNTLKQSNVTNQRSTSGTIGIDQKYLTAPKLLNGKKPEPISAYFASTTANK